MNKKNIIIGIVLVLIAFYGGVLYGQSKTKTISQNGRGGNFTMNQNGARGGARNGVGFTGGEIISKDSNGVTIKMQDGGSKIILISKSTSVTKTVQGSLEDLVMGKQISVNGSTNTDGSITAESIQIRQATSTTQFIQSR